jgi:hypothetical protein
MPTPLEVKLSQPPVQRPLCQIPDNVSDAQKTARALSCWIRNIFAPQMTTREVPAAEPCPLKGILRQIGAATRAESFVCLQMEQNQGTRLLCNLQKIRPWHLLLCAARAYCCNAASLLPLMPFLGVSSLDLGRLWQRWRPLYLVICPICLLVAGPYWHRPRGWPDRKLSY